MPKLGAWERAFLGGACGAAVGAGFGGLVGAIVWGICGAMYCAWVTEPFFRPRASYRELVGLDDDGPYRSQPPSAVSACCCTKTPCPCACHVPPKEPSMPFSPLRPLRRLVWLMLFEPIEETVSTDHLGRIISDGGFAATSVLSLLVVVIASVPSCVIAYAVHDGLFLLNALAMIPVYWVIRAWLRSALHLNDTEVLEQWKKRIYDR